MIVADMFRPDQNVQGLDGFYTLGGWMLAIAVVFSVLAMAAGVAMWQIGSLFGFAERAAAGKKLLARSGVVALLAGGLGAYVIWLKNLI